MILFSRERKSRDESLSAREPNKEIKNSKYLEKKDEDFMLDEYNLEHYDSDNNEEGM